MMKVFLLFLLGCFSAITFGQEETVNVDITVKSMASGKKESGVTATIYLGSKTITSSVTTKNGRVNLIVPAGPTYKVELTKPGFVSRFFMLDAKGVSRELIQSNEAPFVLCEVSMFENINGVDFSYVTNNPFTIFKFDGKSPNLIYDNTMAAKMSNKIDQLLAGAQRQEQNNEVQYQAKMKQGEDLATQKNYKEAMARFEQALMFKPADKVAIKRIDDMEKLLTAEQVNVVNGAALDNAFNDLVKAADALRDAKKYQDAIDKYDEALQKKRGDTYCLDEIDRLEKIIKKEKEAKANEEKYKNAMALATTMMGQKSYQTALKNYQEALEAKPNDPTATAKKKEVEKLLEAQQQVLQKKKQYEQLIAEADQSYNDQMWEISKTKYQQALQIESASTYAQGRIKDIDAKLVAINEEKKKQEQIKQLIIDGNALFGQSKWQDAKTKFLAVQQLEATNETAKQQLAAIDLKLKEEAANAEKEKQFKDWVAKGDAAVTGKKFEEALTNYKEAIKIKPDPAVDAKIASTQAEINKLADAAKTKQLYEAAIVEADKLFKANDFQNAKGKYQEALTIDNSQKYPKDQITAIDAKVAELKAQQENEVKFNELMAQAETLMKAESYLDAKDKLLAAKKINPTSKTPDEKIKIIDDLLAVNQAKQELAKQIQSLLTKADNLFSTEKYVEAKTTYQEVLTKEATNAKAQSQITAIDELLAKKKEEEELQKQKATQLAERQAKYVEAIKQGDVLVVSKKYQEAIAKYELAKTFTETPAEADAKIASTNQLMETQKNKEKADALEKQYLVAFNEGVQLQGEQKFDEAIKAYQNAKEIAPNHPEPDLKITEIQKKQAELANAKEAEEKAKQQAKQLAEQIAQLISEGDDLVVNAKYSDAIAKYEKVKSLDPANTVVAPKIENAKQLQAKEQAAKSVAQKEQEYADVFKQGMSLMSEQKYDDAILQFQKASSILPEKEEPKAKIKEAQGLKAQLLEQKSEEELTNKYNAAIREGESLFGTKKYKEALDAFSKASNLKPNEVYPKKKMDELNELIASQKEALDATQKEQQEKERKQKEYQSFLNEGDTKFGSKDFENALKSYQAAAAVINSDEVKGKIELTKQKIGEFDTKKIQEQFAGLMASAAKDEADKQYEKAIDGYQKASRLMPEETAPKTKIEALTKLLEEQKKLQLIDKNYQQAMTEADDAFSKMDYVQAIEKYKLALTFKDEQKPKDQIELAMKKSEEVSRKDEDIQFEKILQFAQQKIDERDFEKALDLIERAEDNRPNEPRLIKLKKEVQNLLALKTQYKDAIAKADESFAQQDYKQAIKLYQDASKILPTETYPSQQIAKIDEIQKNGLTAQKNEEEYASLLKEAIEAKKKEKYDNALNLAGQAKNLLPEKQEAKDLINEIEKLILAANEAKKKSSLDGKFKEILTVADQLFESKQWSKAKTEYNKALAIKTGDEYVKKQILKCSESLAAAELNRSKYLAVIATADQDFKASEYLKAKKGYELALTYDGKQPYPKNQIKIINKTLQDIKNASGATLDPLGDEEIDATLVEGAALLAKAEAQRRTQKGELIKDKRNIAIERTDSVRTVTKNHVAGISDSLSLTKEKNVQDLTDYYDNQFGKDKLIKEEDKKQDDWYKQVDGYTYSDQLEDKRKLGLIDGMVVERNREYIDHNFNLVDSVRFVTKDIGKLYNDNSSSDYDAIMGAKGSLHNEKETQVKNQIDDVEFHWEVVKLSDEQWGKAVEEDKRQQKVHHSKVDEANDLITHSDDLKLENDRTQVKGHEIFLDKVKENRGEVIATENANYNDVYTKQMKARTRVKEVETQEHNANLAYIDDKMSDIDRSRTRLNDANRKFETDSRTDSLQRDNTHQELKKNEQGQIDKNFVERKKSTIKADNVKNVSTKEETLQIAKNTDKREGIYDTRAELKQLQYAEVKFPPKVANSIGKSYPEGVSQEVFKENGPDGLPIAIITRRIVVKNGFGDVYTRTQKYGSITYTKNGDICTEMIWRNGTTGPDLEKHY